MALNGLGQLGGFFKMGMDPNAHAQKYAKQNGISLEDAKNELKAKHGDPQQPQQSIFNGKTEDFESENKNKPNAISLMSLGLPFNVILQGDNAIKNFAEQNDINLPEQNKLNFFC